MDEYIDREAFKKSIEEHYCKPCKAEGRDHNGCWCRACWVDDMLDEVIDAPPADVAPVVHGRWISKNHHGYEWVFVCSNCDYIDGYPFNDRPNYCPNCGARMDEPIEENDK